MTLFFDNGPLLKAFRAGERDALEAVYREYAPALAGFLRKGFSFSSRGSSLFFRGYREPFDLDNAMQETFLKAFQPRARQVYDGVSPYRNYLFTIARNLVLSEFRRRETAMSQLLARSDGDAADFFEQSHRAANGDDAERGFLLREALGLYQAFIGELSEPDRRFFRARFEEGSTRAIVSKTTGLSAMQVRTREAQLKRRFLSFMQTRGYLEDQRPEHLALTCLANV